MKKILLSLVSTSVFAVYAQEHIVNQWAFDADGDFSTFTLSNDKGNKIELSCENTKEGKKGKGHSYRFYQNENDRVSQVTFKIDGKNFTPPNYANQAKQKGRWNNFIKALVKGKKIEILSGKKKLATFSAKDRGAIADLVNECVL